MDIGILIADHAFLVRTGLRTILASRAQMRLLGEATNRTQLIDQLDKLNPEILILDYCGNEYFSIKDVQHISQQYPQTAILIIAHHLNRQEVIEILEFGVPGFLLKECDEEEIIDAIYALKRGEKFFCTKVLDILLEKRLSPEEKGSNCDPTLLTARETEIVLLMAQGIPAREMAKRLSLSVHTIYTHRKNIKQKLGVSSTAEVIWYAVQTAFQDAG